MIYALYNANFPCISLCDSKFLIYNMIKSFYLKYIYLKYFTVKLVASW